MTSPSIPAIQAPPKKSRFWRFLKRVLIGVVLLLVCAALTGAAYQAIANWRDARRFPQEGRSIALGAEFSGVSLDDAPVKVSFKPRILKEKSTVSFAR